MVYDNEKIWNTILGELEVILSKANYRTWFRNTSIASNDGKTVVIAVPSSFAEEWLKNKYHKQIFESLKKLVPEILDIKYKITTQKAPVLEKKVEETPKVDSLGNPPLASPIQNQEKPTTGLISDFVFDSYVVGNSNRLAHAICLAVSKNPGGKKYNPLFIYGGVGLGKTHLIHAIGNEILKKDSGKKIIYAPCENFANEFINSIQNHRGDTFKKKYRNADLLLIDDIQFLGGKEGTQEEFFHTFNSLYQTNKQIILTADRVPQAIPELASRLSSRLAGGMVVDIKTPDLETRSAILKAKCKQKNLNLDNDAIFYIAENISSNIRELEGSLNKISTHCELYNEKPILKNIMKILEDYIASSRNKNISPDKIFKAIADFFSIKVEDLLGKKRNKELVYPRQISMYLLRNEMGYSYPQIGKALGGKDHTTIIYGADKIQKEIQKNHQLQREISLIKEKLYL